MMVLHMFQWAHLYHTYEWIPTTIAKYITIARTMAQFSLGNVFILAIVASHDIHVYIFIWLHYW